MTQPQPDDQRASARGNPATPQGALALDPASRLPFADTLNQVPSKIQSLAKLSLLLLPLLSCHRDQFPTYPADYREFAYISNGTADTVTILDLVYLRQDRVLHVGHQPSGMAVNPVRNEVYAVNSGSDSVSVIDASNNTLAVTIGVHHKPYFIDVAPDGKRAYVANSGSNTVSVLDLDKRHEIGTAATGEGPGLARVSPDNRTLVVSNRIAGSVSIYTINASPQHPLQFREAFSGCPGATDIAIGANSPELTSGSKAFVACSGSNKVMVVWLAAAPDSWSGSRDISLQQDRLLCLLDVGKTPTHLALSSRSAARLFTTNFDSGSISEIDTWTNEVVGTTTIGSRPSRAVLSADDSTLWVTNFGADSAAMYSVDDSRLSNSVRTGNRPDALAFSADEHMLLVADSGSSDIAVIRTQNKDSPTLFTLLPAGPNPNDLVVKSFHAK
jgi:YVTN family beta-propeller protein